MEPLRICMTLNEADTRTKLIDPVLERVGWKVKGSYVKEEVNPVKSKFQLGEYIGREAGIERGVDRFIDYLLLDEDRSPIAIIESKKTSISVEKGDIQARTYRDDIEKQIKSGNRGAAQQHFNIGSINKLKIPLPPLPPPAEICFHCQAS